MSPYFFTLLISVPFELLFLSIFFTTLEYNYVETWYSEWGIPIRRQVSSLSRFEFVLGDGLSKARSLSDQPVSCPLCGAILRQSRNLRRHLELLHFGLGNSSKSGIHARHRRVAAAVAADRVNDFGLSSLACVRPTARLDSHLAARSSEASDFPMMTPLSITSSVSSASSVSLPGELQVIHMLFELPRTFYFL